MVAEACAINEEGDFFSTGGEGLEEGGGLGFVGEIGEMDVDGQAGAGEFGAESLEAVEATGDEDEDLGVRGKLAGQFRPDP